MSLPLIFITAFTIAFSGAVMPGPVLTATIHQVAKRGAWAGVLIAAGHAILELVLVVALYFGLGRLLEDERLFNNVLGSVGLVGGALLLGMAWGMARYEVKAIEAEDEGKRKKEKGKNGEQAEEEGKRKKEKGKNPEQIGIGEIELQDEGRGAECKNRLRFFPFSFFLLPSGCLEPVAAGMLTSLSNPYWMGWWVTVGLPLVAKSRSHALVGLGVFYVGHVLADFTWYGAVGFALAEGKAFAGGTAFKWLIRFCSVFMAVMGVYFVVSGIGFLRAMTG